MSIQATQQRLDQIFNLANYQFEIPSYQRPYAWSKDQILELIDDIVEAFPYFNDNSNDYFLGSIILIEKPKKPEVEVVDGQQRLTSLTLLFSVFRHLLSPESDAHKYIDDFIEKKGVRNTQYGLKVREQDDKFFGDYIRTVGGIKNLLEKSAGLDTDSQTLLRDNARILVKELIDRCPENVELESWILHLLENILEKCYLVTVSTSDFDTAYRIFSTINTRGLDLQLNDVLKSDIIGKIQGEKEKEKYTKIWDQEESDLGRKDFEALFSHIHRIKLREKQKLGLLTEYRKKIKPQDNPIEFIDKVLKPCSDKFEVIRDQKFTCDNEEDKKQVNRLFGWLNLIDNSDWLPPAIYFLVKHNNKTSDIKNFFINLERLAAGLMILRADINERGRRYAKILDAIDEDEQKAITVTKELLSSEEQNQVIEILDGNLYLQTRSRLYVLKRLDSLLAEGGLSPSFDEKVVTIEHVLPQNPKSDSEWCQIWQDEAREKWVHRLGNLVLLSRQKNSQAQNYDFEDKKEKYFDKGNPTIFPITVNVIRQTEKKTEQINWNEQIVEYNQQEYLQKLLNLWNLEQSIIPTSVVEPKKPKTTKKDLIESPDFYVNFLEGDRSWEDWQKYGFIAGGNGKWYSQTLKNLSQGDRIFVNYCGSGYVGSGIVEKTVVPVNDFYIEINGEKVPIWKAPIQSKNIDHDRDDLDLCEYFVKVKWLKTLPKNEAYWEKGMFAITHTCCRLRHQETREKLYKHFGIDHE
ncbi:DUF262 domain-containing HNH endonuclease family protein [Geminocystis sp. GBBB08]|uniref:DUF262 domain-containing protein n=1 Tax=Geminocystis sp. GBBB08 TaxID=2604140 RepID=UPI0027E37796|nr:DUF262 domain-containing HNH endonuclease family protein [Geminocystis sp. GBBB08]MBL1211419.1 DUF262 domain-containing protein [Geminocystis sp. GBBB08]